MKAVEKPPRGVQKINPRAAEAARLQGEGLSYVQIAATMGATVGAVRDTIQRLEDRVAALRSMRDRLEAER